MSATRFCVPECPVIFLCPDMVHSEHNGFDYCGKVGCSAYCRPDSRTSAHECPRGYPAHKWMVHGGKYTALVEMERRRAMSFTKGKQATLEGF